MPTVLYEKRYPIAYVTLNRPETLNAINTEMNQELEHAWYDFDADPGLWIAILTATGDKAFSSGADLRALGTGNRDSISSRPVRGLGRGIDIYKPIICGIQGQCLAGGLDLALACDIRVASEEAVLGMTSTRWGVPASTAASLLPRTIGWTKAIEMLITATRVSAEEAYRIGMVNRVVPRDQLMATCEEYAHTILRNSPVAVRLTKEAALRGADTTKAESLKIGSKVGALNRFSEDASEGPKAFIEKREPEWKGK